MPLPLILEPTGQQIAAPTSWADVTLRQFVDLYAPALDDPRTPVEVLLGLEAGALGQLAAAQVPMLTALLSFASDPGPVLESPHRADLPDVGVLPYACVQLVQQRFEADEGRPELVSLPYLLAVYRCQLRDGNTGHADELEQQLLAVPVTEVYGDGAFFLAGSRRLVNGTAPSPTMSPTPPTRSWTQAVASWLLSLVLSSRWIRSRAAIS